MLIITADRLGSLESFDEDWYDQLVLDLEIIARFISVSPTTLTVCGLDSHTPPLNLVNQTKEIDPESAQKFQFVRIAAQLSLATLYAYRVDPVYGGTALLDPAVRSILDEQTKHILELNLDFPG